MAPRSNGLAPDGSPVDVYLRFRRRTSRASSTTPCRPAPGVLELGCGAGRLTHALHLGRLFPAVLLASHLVNDVDERRAAYLATCRRHVEAGGSVLIQRLDPALDWLAHEGRPQERGGVSVTLRGVRLRGRQLSATAEHRIGDDVWRQPFTSRLLDDDELAAELGAAGLHLARFLDEKRTWALAEPDDLRT